LADTLTTNYQWVMPQDQGSPDTWGQKLNADLQAIDSQVFTNAQIVEGIGGQVGVSNVTVASAATPLNATFSFLSYQGSVGPPSQQLRWQWAMDTTTESGSAATSVGSNLNLLAYDNTGVALPGSPLMTVVRNTTIHPPGSLSPQSGPAMTVNCSMTDAGLSSQWLAISNPTPGTEYTAINFAGVSGTGQQENIGQITVVPTYTSGGHGFGGTITLGTQVSSITLGAPGSPVPYAVIDGQFAVQSYKNETIIALQDSAGNNATTISWSGPNAGQAGTFTINNRAGSLILDASNNFTFQGSGTAYKAGGGTWTAPASDARVKTVDADYQTGLAAVLALRPVHYTYKGNDGDRLRGSFVGLVAQEAEEVMPEMVAQREGTIDGRRVRDLRTVDTSNLIFALVNAVKELAAELDELKARR